MQSSSTTSPNSATPASANSLQPLWRRPALPTLQFEVTEHCAMQAVCRCGKVHKGVLPAGVNAGVQYGPRAQAVMVHLNQNHAVSVQRTSELMNDLFGLALSQATVMRAVQSAGGLLAPTAQAIAEAAVKSAVLHADEIGIRVAKRLHWLYVLANDTLTWLGAHPKRGIEAFVSLALLQKASWLTTGCSTRPCNASTPCVTPTTCTS
jgi:transposase